MNIKKLITGLTMTMLLSSGVANADYGDVYYCQMTHFEGMNLSGEHATYALEKFRFKLDLPSKSMVYGDNGFYADAVSKITLGYDWPSDEVWYARNGNDSLFFQRGKFLHSIIGPQGSLLVLADCDVF